MIVNKLPVSSVSVSSSSWITLWSSGLLCTLSYVQLKSSRWLVRTCLIREFVEVYTVFEGHPGSPHFCEKFTSLRCTVFKWDISWLRKRQKNEQSAHFHSAAIESIGHVLDCTAGWRLDLVLPKEHCSLDRSPESFTVHSRCGWSSLTFTAFFVVEFCSRTIWARSS